MFRKACRTLTVSMVTLMLLCSAFVAHTPAVAADNDALRAQIQQVLQDNPDLLMEILRDNSEDVYRIVMDGAQKARAKAQLARWKSELGQPKQATIEGRAMRGPKEAPVTIVAFSDFTCPYCEQMAYVVSNVLRHYAGTVNFVFKQFPLESHQYARESAEYFTAAAMQDNAKAWALHDALFADRQRLMEEGVPFIEETAKKVGLDVKKLAEDAKSEAVQNIIAVDMQEAAGLNMQGTPYFLVNNIVIRGAVPFDLFSEAVDMALEYENNK